MPAERAPRGRRRQRLQPARHRQGGRHPGQHACGASSPGSSAAATPTSASARTTRAAPTPAPPSSRDLLAEHAPCVVLIDEWIAYARQLWNRDDLPGRQPRHPHDLRAVADRGGQVGAQLRCSSSRSRRRTRCATPAPSEHSHEIGGVGGVEALQAAARRSSTAPTRRGSRPARTRASRSSAGGCSSAIAPDDLVHRDVTCRRFAEMYAKHPSEFPARGAPRRLRDADEGRLPDPPRAVRPPLPGLVDAGALPAHPRRPAAHGDRRARAVDAQRQEPADPAVVDPARRHQRLRGDHQPPRRQLEAGRRPGRRRARAACPPRSTASTPRSGAPRPPSASPARSSSAPRPPSTARATAARVRPPAASRTCASRSARRSPATRPALFGDALRRLTERASVPQPRRTALLALDAADRHRDRPRPRPRATSDSEVVDELAAWIAKEKRPRRLRARPPLPRRVRRRRRRPDGRAGDPRRRAHPRAQVRRQPRQARGARVHRATAAPRRASTRTCCCSSRPTPTACPTCSRRSACRRRGSDVSDNRESSQPRPAQHPARRVQPARRRGHHHARASPRRTSGCSSRARRPRGR